MRVLVAGNHMEAKRWLTEMAHDPREIVEATRLERLQGLRFTFNDVIFIGTWAERRDIVEIMDLIKRNNIIFSSRQQERDVLDFGNDALHNRCQVRSKTAGCPNNADYMLEVNPYTDRRVCSPCLAPSIAFALTKGASSAIIVSRIKKELPNV